MFNSKSGYSNLNIPIFPCGTSLGIFHVCPGIKRVALLDFDVHHGNGTEACVAATAPTLRSFSFKTPFSEGSQTFPVFSPWLDTDDADNILFAR